MPDINKATVTIRYKTEFGDAPSDSNIIANEPLKSNHLPELSASRYKFLGWVHVNPAGHQSSLSERMILSTDWLIPISVANNEYYVIFTAKWKNDKKTTSGAIYEGEYTVIPKVTEQILPTAETYLEDDVTVKSIPYYNVSNTAGGSSVYIGSEL